MNNYKAIQAQWSELDMKKYPNLLNLIAQQIKAGMKRGEKVN